MWCSRGIAAQRRGAPAGGLLVGALIVLWGGGGDPDFGTPRYALIASLLGLSAWCWLLAILGFGLGRLDFSTPFLRYANEAVLPFYVLHQSVLLGVGYFGVRWDLPDPLKAIAIAASAFAIVVVHEFLVRRSAVLRALFGMRPRAAPAPVPAGAE